MIHAQELAQTPVNMWVQKKSEQAKEIQAVKAGQFPIIGRRSWAFPYVPECYTKSTLILTKQHGWIPVEEMKKEDWFATRSDKGEFQWQQATRISKSYYEGPVLHFKNLGVDLMVTPNHRMLGRKVVRGGKDSFGEVGFVRADKLLDLGDTKDWSTSHERFEIPLTSNWVGKLPSFGTKVPIKPKTIPKFAHNLKSYEVPLEDWVAFLGLFLAEGSTEGAHYGMRKHDYKDKRSLFVQAMAASADQQALVSLPTGIPSSSTKYRVRISQKSSSIHYKEIEKLLAKLPFSFSKDGHGWACGVKSLWQELSPLGNSHTKYIPEWVKELPPKYLKILLKWYWMGDGNVYYFRTGAGPFQEGGTASKKLAEDILELAQKTGGSASISQKNRKGTTADVGRPSAPTYVIRVHRKSFASVSRPEVEQYKGYVYCPSVPNGTVYVRRVYSSSIRRALVVERALQKQLGRRKTGVGATNHGTGPACWCGNSLHRLRRPTSQF